MIYRRTKAIRTAMIKKFLILVICFFGNSLFLNAQNIPPRPVESIDSIKFTYYKIQFTKRQKRKLKEKKLKLVYLIDSIGTPDLIQVFEIKNQAIIDSLKVYTKRLSKFRPRIFKGKNVQSTFELELEFPNYYDGDKEITFAKLIKYNKSSIEDFEFLIESNERIDIVFSPTFSIYTGSLSNFIKPAGGGLKLDFTYSFKNSMILGFNLSENIVKLKKPFPLEEERILNQNPNIGLVGLNFGRWFKLNSKNKISLIAEFNYFEADISKKQEDLSPSIHRLEGFSFGLTTSYPIPIGKSKPIYVENDPSTLNHFINIHLSYRLNFAKDSFTNTSIGNGSIFELGIGYRFAFKKIKAYKFR